MSEQRDATLGEGQARKGHTISFPVKVCRDSDSDPGIEWFEDATGRHLDPHEVMLALNAFAPSETAQKPVAWRWRIVSTDEIPWLYATEKPNNLNDELFWDVEPLFAASVPSATPQKIQTGVYETVVQSPAPSPAIEQKPDPIAEMCKSIRNDIRLCDHGYIHITCGDCQRRG